jgi:predicted nuclease with TOPRIM domain
MPDPTAEQLRARLAELRRELEVGERRLQQLEAEKAQLRDTLLRISGAVQVIEELLGEATAAPTGKNQRVAQ